MGAKPRRYPKVIPAREIGVFIGLAALILREVYIRPEKRSRRDAVPHGIFAAVFAFVLQTLLGFEAASPLKKLFLDACAQIVAADGRIHAREAELLRAIADSLDCPIPPFVSVEVGKTK